MFKWLVKKAVKAMVESNSESVEEGRGDELKESVKRVGIRRQPSFSSWYDEDEIPRSALLQNEGVNEEDFDFELPLVQSEVSEGTVERERFYSSESHHMMEHGRGSDEASTNGLRNQNEYVPFDIENRHASERNSSGIKNLNHVDYNDTSSKKLENPVSAADVLKTLFLILVWYTFSTFLTLYVLSFLIVTRFLIAYILVLDSQECVFYLL